MAGIQIGIASETKAFKQGIETGLITPLEDAVEALDDLGKSKGPDKLEDGFEAAQKASKNLEKEVKETADTIEKEFKKSYASVKQSSDKGMDAAEDGMKDFKQEANSTAKESAASFDGSAESIVDSFQEIAANAFGGFGPAGAIAGLAAAAGIGLVGAAFTQAGEDAEALAEKTQNSFDQMLASKSEFIGQEFILDNMKDLINNTEELANISKDAAAAGVDESTMLRARAGDTKALAEVQDALRDRQVELADSYAELDKQGIFASESTLAQSKALEELSSRTDSQTGTNAEAARQYRLYTAASNETAFANDVNLQSVDRLTDGVKRLGSGLNQVPKETNPKVTVKYNVDTTDLDRELSRIRNVQVNLVNRNGRPAFE